MTPPEACTAPEMHLVERARVSLQGTVECGDKVSGYRVKRWTVNVSLESLSHAFVSGLVEWIHGVGVKARVEFDACK